MANVSIKFNGKEFLLSCEDGQEEHLEELCQVVVGQQLLRMEGMIFSLPRVPLIKQIVGLLLQEQVQPMNHKAWRLLPMVALSLEDI